MTVVTILKLDDRSPDFLQVPEDATVNGLFLQRPVEALSDAIRLRFGDEGEARRDAPEPDLVEEVIGPCIANRDPCAASGPDQPRHPCRRIHPAVPVRSAARRRTGCPS